MTPYILALCLAASSDTTTFEVTAYCNCRKCCGKSRNHPLYGITASGKRARWGTVAADWRVLPKGTKLKIEGFRTVFTVEDKGGAIKGNRIDVWYSSHRKALKFGRRKLKVTILRRGGASRKTKLARSR